MRSPRVFAVALTRGYVAKVDAADYPDLSAFKWRVEVCRDGRLYARRSFRVGEVVRHEFMHRRLLPDVARVDHRNGDGLDNRRGNLRPATSSQNGANRRGLDADNTSGYRGVIWEKDRRKWRAQIQPGRLINLGRFDDPEDAARAYDAAAREWFGDYAGYLNFPEVS